VVDRLLLLGVGVFLVCEWVVIGLLGYLLYVAL
jgi:hypothetical protein